MKEVVNMELKQKKIGIAITGSFCTFSKIFDEIINIVNEEADVYPILSYSCQNNDCRFGRTEDYTNKIINITGKKPILTLEQAEPIGPKSLLDLLLIAPCTGNTLAKLANGITDTPVLMAAKGHLRNNKPVVISISSNDSLGLNLKNIGILLCTKNIYFVPFGQDNFKNKPNSMIAHTNLIIDTLKSALDCNQIQPVIVSPKK